METLSLVAGGMSPRHLLGCVVVAFSESANFNAEKGLPTHKLCGD